MNDAIHKKQIKWPYLITQNVETGKYTAVLKGFEGVIAQGDTFEEVMNELTISLQAMLEYYASEKNKSDDGVEEVTDGKTEQKELILELAC
jgi:predicted RNase H-like HicB family nuclease